jgi:hypothetical protein
MSVSYRFVDKEGNRLITSKSRGWSSAGCWGVLKQFKYSFESCIQHYEKFLKMSPHEQRFYPDSYRNGSANYLGIPLDTKLEDITHLEYLMPLATLRSKTKEEFLVWIQHVADSLPMWFKDFSFKREGSEYIASVDCSGSFLRNYNALRFLRSIVYRYIGNQHRTESIPIEALLVFSEAYYYSGTTFKSIGHMGDNVCVPFRHFDSLKDVLERVHSGPIECGFDTPLLFQDNKSLDILKVSYGTTYYPLSNAFLTTTERMGGEAIGDDQSVPSYIPRYSDEYIEKAKEALA